MGCLPAGTRYGLRADQAKPEPGLNPNEETLPQRGPLGVYRCWGLFSLFAGRYTGLNVAAALREWTCPVAGTHFQRHIPPRHGGFGPRMPDLTVFRPLALLHLFLVRW
jgi:hypothetical protein